MNIIEKKGGYFAEHVVCDKNACVKWYGFNFKEWHVGIFAMTRHGITLVGVVSPATDETFTWWTNCHGGKFEAEICSLARYSAPDTDVLTYCGSRRDFLDCIEAATAFLTDDDDY